MKRKWSSQVMVLHTWQLLQQVEVDVWFALRGKSKYF